MSGNSNRSATAGPGPDWLSYISYPPPSDEPDDDDDDDKAPEDTT